MKSILNSLASKQQAAHHITQYYILILFLLPALVQSTRTRNNIPSTDADQYHHQDNYDQSQDRNRDGPSPDSSYDIPEAPSVTTDTNTYPAPKDLEIVRINDTAVVLRWFLPNDAANDQLQFFKIQYKPTRRSSNWNTESREIPPNIRAYQINGLRPGNYFFIVSAVYENDDNASSDRLKFRLRATKNISNELPEQRAPDIFWTEASYDYIRAKWKYTPKDKDFEYNGYLVYYRSAHAVADFTIYNTLDENVEIAELEPETPYEVKVVAYNANGVSEFSETKTITTKAKSNTTTTQIPQSPMSSTTTTTMRPAAPPHNPPTDSPSSKLSSNYPSATIHTISTPPLAPPTPKPPIDLTGPTNGPSNSSSVHNWFESMLSEMNSVIDGHDHKSLAIRYTIFILLPISLITIVLACSIACYNRRKESPPQSTHASIQFDLEINGYFKNSFPGVEKEYTSMANHHAHHGFVNNHPQINDFA